LNTFKRSVLFIIVLTFVCTSVAFTANPQETAYKLFELNLMKGDGDGFNLEGQLKRSEAATFIVKLLGEESEVLGNKASYLTNQFSDVEPTDWYAPFVGYCHKKGIVSGFPDGTYKPEEYVSEKAFLTMILGAMGYEAGPDFHWDNVLQIAYEKGLVEDITYAVRTDDNSEYKRNEVVNALYNALNKEIKAESRTMVDRLVDNRVTNLLIAKKYNLIRVDDIELALENVKLNTPKTLVLNFTEVLSDLNSDQIEIMADGDEIEYRKFDLSAQTLTIEFENELYDDSTYQVVLSNLVDEQGNSTKRLESKFEGVEREIIETDEFKIAFIESVSNKYMDIHFTQPITSDAEQVLLYKYGKAGSSLTEGSFKSLSAEKIDDKTVRLELLEETLIEGDDYEVFVRGDIVSAYGTYLNDGNGENSVFRAQQLDLESFEISSVEVVDKRVIEIWYSRAVDEETAFDKTKYKLRDLKYNSTKTPNGVHYYQDEDGIQKDRLVLTYSTLRKDVEYEFEIRDIYDEFGSDSIPTYKERFEIGDLEDVRPELIGIEVQSRSKIALRFNYPLSDASDSASIYVNQNMTVSKVKVNDEDPFLLDVYFAKNRYLNDEKEYEVEVRGGLKDYLLRSPRKAIEDTFWGTDENRESIQITKAKYIDASSILVEFSEAVRSSDASDIDNYSFEYRSGKVKRTLYPYEVNLIKDNSAILKMDSQVDQGTLVLQIDELYEYSGQYKYSELTYTVDRWND